MQTVEQPTKLFDSDLGILDQIQKVDLERRRGVNDNSLPIVDVGIPQTIIIDCPIVRPMSRYANKCQECAYFNGIVQTAWSSDEEIPWPAKYAIRCGFILERKTRQMVIE